MDDDFAIGSGALTTVDDVVVDVGLGWVTGTCTGGGSTLVKDAAGTDGFGTKVEVGGSKIAVGSAGAGRIVDISFPSSKLLSKGIDLKRLTGGVGVG